LPPRRRGLERRRMDGRGASRRVPTPVVRRCDPGEAHPLRREPVQMTGSAPS